MELPSRETVAHGLRGGRAPRIEHVQAVLDRLAPQPTTASALRWSSDFRISHRLVDRYGVGRVFVAGDAAHIHLWGGPAHGITSVYEWTFAEDGDRVVVRTPSPGPALRSTPIGTTSPRRWTTRPAPGSTP